ncbi:hypothetical protein BJ508DRAFT_343084 [Ascobolus immersus RN42]|uniref:Uncharacterized protein n=1 Tax=Ascobolus immersus RN42 TaxID=1160509 RepID=A0A3N4HS28_ASCIM|nr:hypothetical protein BJ508DRAFT_343084 [Ascobolus immersus RN42]
MASDSIPELTPEEIPRIGTELESVAAKAPTDGLAKAKVQFLSDTVTGWFLHEADRLGWESEDIMLLKKDKFLGWYKERDELLSGIDDAQDPAVELNYEDRLGSLCGELGNLSELLMEMPAASKPTGSDKYYACRQTFLIKARKAGEHVNRVYAMLPKIPDTAASAAKADESAVIAAGLGKSKSSPCQLSEELIDDITGIPGPISSFWRTELENRRPLENIRTLCYLIEARVYKVHSLLKSRDDLGSVFLYQRLPESDLVMSWYRRVTDQAPQVDAEDGRDESLLERLARVEATEKHLARIQNQLARIAAGFGIAVYIALCKCYLTVDDAVGCFSAAGDELQHEVGTASGRKYPTPHSELIDKCIGVETLSLVTVLKDMWGERQVSYACEVDKNALLLERYEESQKTNATGASKQLFVEKLDRKILDMYWGLASEADSNRSSLAGRLCEASMIRLLRKRQVCQPTRDQQDWIDHAHEPDNFYVCLAKDCNPPTGTAGAVFFSLDHWTHHMSTHCRYPDPKHWQRSKCHVPSGQEYASGHCRARGLTFDHEFAQLEHYQSVHGLFIGGTLGELSTYERFVYFPETVSVSLEMEAYEYLRHCWQDGPSTGDLVRKWSVYCPLCDCNREYPQRHSRELPGGESSSLTSRLDSRDVVKHPSNEKYTVGLSDIEWVEEVRRHFDHHFNGLAEASRDIAKELALFAAEDPAEDGGEEDLEPEYVIAPFVVPISFLRTIFSLIRCR